MALSSSLQLGPAACLWPAPFDPIFVVKIKPPIKVEKRIKKLKRLDTL